MLLDDEDIKKAREILGDSTKDLSDDELKNQLVMIQFLVESWTDEFERKIFNGKTLNELLGGL